MNESAGGAPTVGDGAFSGEPTAEAVEELIGEILDADEAVAGRGEAADPIVERDAFLADLQRVSAEFSNFKKQTERRNSEVASRARADLVQVLLPVLDACDMAVDQGSDGVEPIRAAISTALTPLGFEVIDPAGEAFDPNRHEAVIHEADSDGASEGLRVVEVMRRGYGWAGRVMRPAMVRVQG
ncbi:MAG: nucleotide exchange factor GrpE [Acidimicrobiales bacterium]|nr:nucleotide exchange factor GrpE [Acidimicrobiales bacterium]